MSYIIYAMNFLFYHLLLLRRGALDGLLEHIFGVNSPILSMRPTGLNELRYRKAHVVVQGHVIRPDPEIQLARSSIILFLCPSDLRQIPNSGAPSLFYYISS